MFINHYACLLWPKDQREPCNKIGSQSPVKHINGIQIVSLPIQTLYWHFIKLSIRIHNAAQTLMLRKNKFLLDIK